MPLILTLLILTIPENVDVVGNQIHEIFFIPCHVGSGAGTAVYKLF